ncbi:uroporphyrinogen-III C-methyltransferase [Alicyclobacillus tolerans]|uniref:Uroporphyrinogen-III C-methyltransferase n=1 Tax=Alicyclobacillus tolerans TaxID=90970 RepID=A0A1M6LZI0_9BACL|nr:uroporphyrinogen-III C-methyltransferase [Alicyclobacillus montanus]SHJ76636.1 uroporphyrinogen III methyltransferase / synthase [Alicyclobacillus montanus]
MNGKVYLVGAGPGVSGLLTLRGKEVIETADILFYDRLISPRLFSYASPQVEAVYVGKANRKHTMPQEEICRCLICAAREGKRVVRLKGGDPFVFGRGGEEAFALREAGIDYEIVPGVTSPVGALAYAGIPLTHRGLANSFTVVTGHQMSNDELLDWQNVWNRSDTLVILMGLEQWPEISQRLLLAGVPVETKAAILQAGSTALQKRVDGNLANIGIRSQKAGIHSPALVVLGEVAGLAPILDWQSSQPLFGSRILVVTRDRALADHWVRRIESLGGEAMDIVFEENRHVLRPAALTALQQLWQPESIHAVWIEGDIPRKSLDLFFPAAWKNHLQTLVWWDGEKVAQYLENNQDVLFINRDAKSSREAFA